MGKTFQAKLDLLAGKTVCKYAVIPVDILSSGDLTCLAKVVYMILLNSDAETFTAYTNTLITQTKVGKDAIRQAINDLEAAGLIERSNYSKLKRPARRPGDTKPLIPKELMK